MPPRKNQENGRLKSKSRAITRKGKAKLRKTTMKHKQHICEGCGKTFMRLDMYHKHVLKCLLHNQSMVVKDTTAWNFKCKKCTKRFRFKSSYKKHCENEHSVKPDSIPCKECSVVCPNEIELKTHIANVHERQIFHCDICSKKFSRYTHVLRHKTQTWCGGGDFNVYSCKICPANFTRKDNLIAHLRKKHLSRKGFHCKTCPYSTHKFNKLVLHHQRLHTENPDHFECDYCGKITGSRSAMAKHLEIHGDKKYGCEKCGYTTFTLEVMRRHIMTHLTLKPHKCTMCKASFIQKLQLERHLAKHTGNSCASCGLKFKSVSELKTHCLIHSVKTKADFLCPINKCSMKQNFKSYDALKKHLDEHNQTKVLECVVCKKLFNSQAMLKSHTRSHTLDRPRRCMYCLNARAYVRGTQLVKHVRKAHPDAFRQHLMHVRVVMGASLNVERVKQSELDSILNLLDAEAERIIEGYGGEGVLYGGMQEVPENEVQTATVEEVVDSPLMCEEELASSLTALLRHLVDTEELSAIAEPDEPVDLVLERIISQCGVKPADRGTWSRVQCLRENTKHLFQYVIEDQRLITMMETNTVDQVVRHILRRVNDNDEDDNEEEQTVIFTRAETIDQKPQ